MRVLWVGDAGVSSGFARCTHAVCDRLAADGHRVEVIGINYWGEPHDYDYPIHPPYNPHRQARSPFGEELLQHLVLEQRPDVVVILNDPWNVGGYVQALDMARAQYEGTGEGIYPSPKLVGWLAVDAENHRIGGLDRLDSVVTWTEWGLEQLRRSGYEGRGDVVPLGVDEDFEPFDREAAARSVNAEGMEGAFVVGVVGRNQPRKRLDLTLRYFAKWLERYPNDDAWLYLHVGPTGDNGFDLKAIAKHYGLEGRVAVMEGSLGRGIPDLLMRMTYSRFDVYASTTQGEGWGLPALEAMACGVPCILPDFAAFSEWPEDAAVRVPCHHGVASAPMNSRMFTLGAVPAEEPFIEALQALYVNAEGRRRLGDAGRALAANLTWGRTADSFVEVLESVVADQPVREAATA